MRIGVPKEIKVHEYRVGLTPASVAELVAHGHELFVETKAGNGIDCPDSAYEKAGAKIDTVVSGSPADSSGLKAGDVVTAVGGTQISTADDLTAAVNAYKPGDKATLTVDRNGSTKSISVTFGTRPS